MNLKLIRKQELIDRTIGLLICDNVIYYTLELPYKDNKKNVSRIKEGTYNAKINVSTKFGICIRLEDKNGRKSILIHAGNTPKDTQGCILIALRYTNDMLLQSRSALSQLTSYLGSKDFTEFKIEVKDEFNMPKM